MNALVEPIALGAARAALDLAGLVREAVAAGVARDVLHLRVGTLGPELRRPHHLRQLRETLDAALDAARVRVFELPNGDVVAIARPPTTTLDSATAALQRLLDPLPAAALRRLRLPEDAAVLLSTAAASLGLEASAVAEPPPAKTGAPFGSAELAAAERALAAADLSSLTLGQTVCRLPPDGSALEPLWEDRRIDWPALTALLLPGRDLTTAPGLMRRLARATEARLLAELARPAAQTEWRAIGLALALATLDSAAFERFAEALPAGRHAELTLGLRPSDLLADTTAAARLLPSLRRRGFRLALDDAAAGFLALVPPARLGLDLVRLRWTPTLPTTVPETLHALLAETPERLVLTGVDRPAAVAWGWEVGFRLFQGPLVERRRRGA